MLAHEISHVAQRHIARMIEGQRSNLAITLGSVLLAILAARAGGSSGGERSGRYRNGVSGCHDPVSAELFAKRRARS